MVVEPRNEEEAADSLQDKLTGRIRKLTNFTEKSFNTVWTEGFAQGLRDSEIRAISAQLSGWIDYAGGPIDQNDLNALDINNVSPDEINEYVEDEDLDELVKIVGIERDPGVPATGDVNVTTITSQTTIPEGTEFGTMPDSSGEYSSFYTTEEMISPHGTREVVISVRAEDVGTSYNVGAGQIEYMPNPPTGVDAVTNVTPVDGGVNVESNDDLRERARNAVFLSSGGGTVLGVQGYIESNTEARDVILDEYYNEQPPYVDVITDGGDEDEVIEAIERARPIGIEHNLIRPMSYTIGISTDVMGDPIREDRIREAIIDHINNLGIGNNVYRDKLAHIIFSSDVNVENVVDLQLHVIAEPHEYIGRQTIYRPRKDIHADGIQEVRGYYQSEFVTFEEGNDYEIVENGEGIDFNVGGRHPDMNEDIYIDYRAFFDIELERREKAAIGDVEVTPV